MIPRVCPYLKLPARDHSCIFDDLTYTTSCSWPSSFTCYPSIIVSYLQVRSSSPCLSVWPHILHLILFSKVLFSLTKSNLSYCLSPFLSIFLQHHISIRHRLELLYSCTCFQHVNVHVSRSHEAIIPYIRFKFFIQRFLVLILII